MTQPRNTRNPIVTIDEIKSWHGLCSPCAVEYHRWATHVSPPATQYISNTPQLTRMNYSGEMKARRELRSHYLRSIKADCTGVHHQRGPAFGGNLTYDRLRGCPTIREVFWAKEVSA